MPRISVAGRLTQQEGGVTMLPPCKRRLLAGGLLLALGLAPRVFAGTPEQDLKARHQAIIAAYNRRDVKALRPLFAPGYRYEERTGHKVPLDKYLQGFEAMFKMLPKPGKDSATLTQVSIKGNTATAVELRMVQGFTGKTSGPARTAQTWKKIGGVWKLALEKEMKEDTAAPAR